MAATTAKYLARTARLAQMLEARRAWLADADRQAALLQRAGVVVAGEAWMLGELRGRLDAAAGKLASLAQAANVDAARVDLDALEELLAEAEWDLADSLTDGLREKERTWQETARNYQDQVAEWEAQVNDLTQRLSQGREARAPLASESQEVLRLRALVERAERALRDGQFDILAETLQQLSAEEGKPQQLGEKVSKKVEEVRPFTRQADLLVLQSPLVEGSFPYTVLLRTPSEPGSHGINIQASSTLSRQDRAWMREKVDQITAAVNTGLARQFEIKRGGAAAAPAEGAVAEESTRNVRVVSPVGTPEPPGVNVLARDVGKLMYRLFMPEQMQEYLHETPCSLTITTNDLELPWELMWHEGEHLCLTRPVARMPMGYSFPARRSQVSRGGSKLRFLLIYSDPTGNLPAAGREIEVIRAGLERDWKGQIDIQVIGREQARGHELNSLLWAGTFDVIHYAGHAAFNPKDPDLSGLLLWDEEVFFAQKIRRLLEGRPLVFLNACESGRVANEEQPQEVRLYLQERAEGLAASFIYGGAMGCIGSLWPVYDEPAAQFAVQFYGRVLEGYMVGEAMRLARRQSREHHPNQITWASFVLYGDPTFRLVS